MEKKEKEIKKITQKDLNDILDKHELWLNSRKELGEQADLSYMDLTGLEIANGRVLPYIICKNSIIREMHLFDLNLTNSDFEGSDFEGACLYGSNVSGSNFKGAKLWNVSAGSFYSMNIASIDETTDVFHTVCPEKGSFIGYKRAIYFDKEGNFDIVTLTLEIPSDAERSSGFGNSCRCSKAKVIKIESFNKDTKEYHNFEENVAFSLAGEHDFKYTLGEMVFADKFDKNRWYDCTHGIHFYMKKEELEK